MDLIMGINRSNNNERGNMRQCVWFIDLDLSHVWLRLFLKFRTHQCWRHFSVQESGKPIHYKPLYPYPGLMLWQCSGTAVYGIKLSPFSQMVWPVKRWHVGHPDWFGWLSFFGQLENTQNMFQRPLSFNHTYSWLAPTSSFSLPEDKTK